MLSLYKRKWKIRNVFTATSTRLRVQVRLPIKRRKIKDMPNTAYSWVCDASTESLHVHIEVQRESGTIDFFFSFLFFLSETAH